LQRLPLQNRGSIEDDFSPSRVACLLCEISAMIGLAAEFLELSFHRDF